eukprot:TRINITY_DN21003_c0_g1_i1.p1 TRINITY_DN21003_c0_g1~~TRINITY_DN21003_c0_g1_i1.p1  ORF type:complete len:228 (+),score=26.24 TRINITY_DN21003_c0_g1_i1:52-735(+)
MLSSSWFHGNTKHCNEMHNASSTTTSQTAEKRQPAEFCEAPPLTEASRGGPCDTVDTGPVVLFVPRSSAPAGPEVVLLAAVVVLVLVLVGRIGLRMVSRFDTGEQARRPVEASATAVAPRSPSSTAALKASPSKLPRALAAVASAYGALATTMTDPADKATWTSAALTARSEELTTAARTMSTTSSRSVKSASRLAYSKPPTVVCSSTTSCVPDRKNRWMVTSPMKG